MEAPALINPQQIYYAHLELRGCKKNVLIATLMGFRVLESRERERNQQRQETGFGLDMTVSFLFWTHSDVVNSHPNGPVVIDLLGGDGLCLVS